MTAFTLDTSGAVHLGYVERPDGPYLGAVMWTDLSPFEQGYMEAIKRSFPTLKEHRPASGGDGVVYFHWTFSDLSPETLAAILKDCEAFATTPGTLTWATTDEAQRSVGRSFWLSRNSTSHPLDPAQHGTFTTQILMSVAQRFGALTPYLDDTGKVRLREAG